MRLLPPLLQAGLARRTEMAIYRQQCLACAGKLTEPFSAQELNSQPSLQFNELLMSHRKAGSITSVHTLRDAKGFVILRIAFADGVEARIQIRAITASWS